MRGNLTLVTLHAREFQIVDEALWIRGERPPRAKVQGLRVGEIHDDARR